MRYRDDIDGLRAVAVLPVVFFHAGFSAVSGGFVGVDVFFVISGYLITRLLLEEHDREGRISILGFYERRIRRIFPALFTVIGACVWITLVMFEPEALIRFAQSAASAALFVSNIFFYLELDYFAAAADTEPLIHTWSLAVEEQYYLILPVMMILLLKRNLKTLRAWVVGLSVASFAVSLLLAPIDPQANFFLAPSRAWELFAGSCIALGLFPAPGSQRMKDCTGLLGLLLILGAIVFYDPQTPFPGIGAVPPVLGASLIIWSGLGGAEGLASRFLRLSPWVFFGKISYSLYLWHWPLLVFPVFWLGRDLETWESLTAAALAVVISTLSWRFVEQPFRKRRGWPGRRSIYAGGVLLIALCVFHAVRATEFEGYPKRLPAGYADLDLTGREYYAMDGCMQNKRQTPDDWRLEDCIIPGASESRYLLWGDSFLGHYRPGLTVRDDPLPVTFVEHTKSACPPGFTYEPPSNKTCVDYNEHARDLLEQGGFEGVILGADWTTALGEGYRLEELSQTVAWLKQRGLKVIVIGQSPSFAARVPALFAWGNMGPERSIGSGQPVQEPGLNESVAAASEGALFLDPWPLFCERQTCRFGEGDRLYFWDRGHYTLLGSRRAVDEMLTPAIKRLENPS
jgi:peptidoglycan/LPS O-acetylase OafA/YrhL